jgi:predicted ATP-dependent serine protease
MSMLGLGGLIHLWGDAGAGKTLLATALASAVSKEGYVEWINADAKKSFVTHLKKNVEHSGGHTNNITVTMAESRVELRSIIESLTETISGTSLIVIDPITRVLDMTQADPILWGQELIEVILPTLAGAIAGKDVDIVIISESRMSGCSESQAVHHQSISRWIDHDLHLVRTLGASHSQIFRDSKDGKEELAIMKVDDRGVIQVTPRLMIFHISRGENEIVW